MAHSMAILYLFFCLDLLKNGISELLYIRNTQFSADVDDILNITTYMKFDRIVTSSSECAVLCSAYACDTFYYDVTSGNCRYVIFKANSALIPTAPNGMKNFIIFKEKQVCKSGWIQYGKYCILFSKTMATWTDAKTKCEQMGSQLIILQSTDLNAFVVRRDIGHNAWVGARKMDVWRWVDNTVVTDWFASGYCMQIWRMNYYNWDGYYCYVLRHFICLSTIDLDRK